MMTRDFREMATAHEYDLDCPDGTWTGRLDAKAWGKSANLILYFSEVESGHKYWLSVFFDNGYRARDGGHDFRDDAAPGDVFELTTTKTKSGKPKLMSARKTESGTAAPDEAVVYH